MKLASNVYGNLDGDVTPVVFLHAFPLHGIMWRAQVGSLERPCVTLDFRGYGKSVSEGTEEFSIPLFARDVTETLSSLKINRAIFAGCSMGGYTIFEIWRQAPEMFEAMILVDTKAEADTAEGRQKRASQIEKIRSEGGAFMQQFVVDNLLGPAVPQENAGLVDEVKAWVGQVPDSVFIRTLDALAARHDSLQTLNAINVPTLVIVGEDDKVTPPENAQTLAEKVPDAHLVKISQAGHLTPLERPGAVNAAIRDFLGRF